MNKTIGNLIRMTLICVAVFIVFMTIRPAKAQWTPWGWQHSMAAYDRILHRQDSDEISAHDLSQWTGILPPRNRQSTHHLGSAKDSAA
jgi:hypothetical protein